MAGPGRIANRTRLRRALDAAAAGALLAAALAAGVAPAPARAQALAESLAEDAAGQIEGARAALESAREDPDRLAAVARAGAAAEATLAAMRETLRQSARLIATLESRMQAAHDAGQAALGRLAALARAPLAAQAAQPAGPLAAARGAWLAAALGPADAARAGADGAALDAARAQDARRRAAWSRARGAAIDLRVARAAALGPGGAGATRAGLDRVAGALSDFRAVGPVEDPAGLPPPRPPEPGLWPAPAPGRIVTPWGTRDALGQPLTGVEIAVPEWAVARAPALASVVYAGPLGGRGLAAGLETSPGRLVILGGLQSLTVREGDLVSMGAPVGHLRVIPPASEEILVAAPFPRAAFSAAMLYVETREAGVPVNPARWFALPKGESETP